jgi:hypothetical protein
MEIGPITAIRPVPMVKPLRSDVDLSGVFAIEFRKGTGDEADPSNHRKVARGLEDEEASDEESGEGIEDVATDGLSSGEIGENTISFFA